MNERLVQLHNQARECYFADEFLDMQQKQVERLILAKFAELVAEDAVAKEREACAQVCDPYTHGQWFAEAIRQQGEK